MTVQLGLFFISKFRKFGPHSRNNVMASFGAILDVESICFLIQHIETSESTAHLRKLLI